MSDAMVSSFNWGLWHFANALKSIPPCIVPFWMRWLHFMPKTYTQEKQGRSFWWQIWCGACSNTNPNTNSGQKASWVTNHYKLSKGTGRNNSHRFTFCVCLRYFGEKQITFSFEVNRRQQEKENIHKQRRSIARVHISFQRKNVFIDRFILFARRGVFILTATKICFGFLSGILAWLKLWCASQSEKKNNFTAYWWWMKKLNGKVPRNDFLKMPRRKMDSISNHTKKNVFEPRFCLFSFSQTNALFYSYALTLTIAHSPSEFALNWNLITFLNSHLTCRVLRLDQMYTLKLQRQKGRYIRDIKRKWNAIIESVCLCNGHAVREIYSNKILWIPVCILWS